MAFHSTSLSFSQLFARPTQACLFVIAPVLLLGAGAASARPAKVILVPSSVLRFSAPLTVKPAELSEAVALQNDPLSVVKGLHLYVQGGRRIAPREVKLPLLYCRVDVDVTKVSAVGPVSSTAKGGAQASDGRIPISTAALVLSEKPLRGDPHDYGGGKALPVEEKDQRGILESRWARNGKESEGRGLLLGRSIELRFRDAPGNAVSAIVCFKKGAEYPSEEDLQRAFGALASIEGPTEVAATGHVPTEKEKREAAAQAKAMGQAAPDLPKEEGDSGEANGAPKDRLKEYEESLESKKPAPVVKTDGLEEMLVSPPSPPEGADGGAAEEASGGESGDGGTRVSGGKAEPEWTDPFGQDSASGGGKTAGKGKAGKHAALKGKAKGKIIGKGRRKVKAKPD